VILSEELEHWLWPRGLRGQGYFIETGKSFFRIFFWTLAWRYRFPLNISRKERISSKGKFFWVALCDLMRLWEYRAIIEQKFLFKLHFESYIALTIFECIWAYGRIANKNPLQDISSAQRNVLVGLPLTNQKTFLESLSFWAFRLFRLNSEEFRFWRGWTRPIRELIN